MKDLRKQLEAYAGEGWYPFHMPGHKRRPDSPAGPEAAVDITEIDGFDDLHHPEGILREMQEDAARIFGSRKCRFLVNGSTAGILAAVRAAVPKDGRILVDRRCHISVYHALILGGLRPRYLFPETDSETGIALAPTAEEVRRALAEDRVEADVKDRIRAVILTSPSYEGVTADIRGIAEAAHEEDACLIVDEAHGAHLPFLNRFAAETANREPQSHAGRTAAFFPESAIFGGADLVIQSLHKTMPALTQCALLHNCSERVPQERIDAALDIFQTSSPSYVLMASIVSALRDAEERPEQFGAYAKRLTELREGLAACRRIALFAGGNAAAEGGYDPGKIVLYDRTGTWNGRDLYDLLRERFLLQPEMSAGRYVVLMTSPADTEEGFGRLLAAARELDAEPAAKNAAGDAALDAGRTGSVETPEQMEFPEQTGVPEQAGSPEQVMTPAEAEDAACERGTECVLPAEAVGRVSADFFYCYPPGIPLLVPGERIDEGFVRRLEAETDTVRGLREGKVRVIHG